MSIKAENLTHIFERGTAMETYALRDVSFEIEDGSYVGIIGHTGSGKSTLIQHLNGLMKPDGGTIYYNGEDIFARGYSLRKLRGEVGLVFQYPEYQLFEETVLRDVMFGPLNKGESEARALEKAKQALRLTGVGEELFEESPFDLSGGQKRRVAIAGILAMDPKVLILDEPTAGLDPGGRNEILETVERLNRERGMTIVLVSHSMEDIARYAKKVLVMSNGQLCFYDAPENVFCHTKELEEMGLSAPEISYVAEELRAAGVGIPMTVDTVEEAAEELLRRYRA